MSSSLRSKDSAINRAALARRRQRVVVPAETTTTTSAPPPTSTSAPPQRAAAPAPTVDPRPQQPQPQSQLSSSYTDDSPLRTSILLARSSDVGDEVANVLASVRKQQQQLSSSHAGTSLRRTLRTEPVPRVIVESTATTPPRLQPPTKITEPPRLTTMEQPPTEIIPNIPSMMGMISVGGWE